MKGAKNFGKCKKYLLYCLAGIIIGILNGFFGGGGGMVAVPLLQNVLKFDTKKSHASAILIILPLCVVSIVTYMLAGSFNFSGGMGVSIGVCIGGVFGAVLLKRLNNKIIEYIFAFIMITSGIKLVL